MTNINISIEFFDYWHLGSGLNANILSDNNVLKDVNGFPYLPGKTLKGLLREVGENYIVVNPDKKEIFSLIFKDEKHAPNQSSLAHFSNISISPALQSAIEQSGSSSKNALFETISSTKIGENGIAEDGSLRTMEVSLPLVLEGAIVLKGFSESQEHEAKNFIENICSLVKRMGVKRNRGLGRCIIKTEE